MRKTSTFCICAALSAGLSAQEPPPGARRPPPRHGTIMEMGLARLYDKSKEETIKSKVLEVKEHTRGAATRVSLVVSMDGEEADVPLGPKEYLADRGIAFSKGDEVTIKCIRGAGARPAAGPEAGEGGGPRPGADGRAAAGPDRTGGERADGPAGPKPPKRPAGPKPPDAPDVQKAAGGGEAAGGPGGHGGRIPGAARIRVREITSGGRTLTLLDEKGYPTWWAERHPQAAGKDESGQPAGQPDSQPGDR